MELPEVRFNFKGGKKAIAEAVQEIGKAIFTQVSGSVQAATAAVVPSVPDMVAEIVEDLNSGPISRFEEGLKKVDTLINKFGVDIGKYSKSLGDFLKAREVRATKSETIIRELREKNIVAQMTRMGDIEILSKKQIQEQEDLLKDYNKEIKESTKTITKFEKIQKRGGDITEEQQQDVLDANKKIVETTEKRNKVLETLNKTETEDTRSFREKFDDTIDNYVPDGLREIGAAFTEGLTAPFTAIKELGLQFGSMLKPLKAIPKLLKGFVAGLFGAIIAFIPFLLKAALVVGAIVLLKKAFDFLKEKVDENKEKLIEFKDKIVAIPQQVKDFFDEKFTALGEAFNSFVEDVKAIPGKISDFFEGIFVKIQNFFIDAINSVIELINDFKPGKDIELLENVPMPSDSPVDSPVVTNTDSPLIESAKNVKSVDTKFGTNELSVVPGVNAPVNNASVVVNKNDVNNSSTISSFSSSKNDDKSRMSLYADASP